jgi:hypothetical protein
MKKFLFISIAFFIAANIKSTISIAQQYKIKQSTEMMGMKTESTIYVKGMRKRTEAGGMMGMPAPPVIIEQCDLQRTIKLNDKKKLYFIEPFAKETEEVIDEDAKPVAPVKNKPVATKTTPQKGGVIYMWYNITDTGERKKMSGFTARHVWTSQKIKPSADACTMKDSIIIKTDGWYIDLPEFNCPITYRPSKTSMPPNEKQMPDCQDKFVTRRSGKGKLGFPLTETRTIIMGSRGSETSEFVTNLETIEFSTAKLDSMLFVIPPGYKEAAKESDLEEKFDINDMINQYKKENNDNVIFNNTNPAGDKMPGTIRIGVYEPTGGDGQLPATELQQYLANSLKNGSIDAVTINSEEDAKKYNCDYTLSTDFVKIKQGSKAGGLIKAIKNADPNAASSYNIDANMTLKNLADGSTRLQPSISGKFEGKIDVAANRALDDGSRQILKGLR